MRQPEMFKEIIVDSFAGGGGASTGIELALGRPVDIAINHDPAAIAMHRANHPDTEHYCESFRKINCVKCEKYTGQKPVFGKCGANESDIYECVRRLFYKESSKMGRNEVIF